MEERMKEQFEMVAKTMQGLEDILAEELRGIGALNVEPGRRMVSFEGTLETLYKANMCCRTALRILKPIYKFIAHDTDELYEMTKEMDWSRVLSLDKTFSIDTVAYSDEFSHSRFVTYRVKDAIVDWFKDKYGPDKRPGVRLQDADVMLNVHVAGERVTISLDSSGESLHKRGYRVAQTEAPINEVLAAGIILKSGWRGDSPLVDPMCGSGTFLVEAALIAANIMPGVYRQGFAFENWPDFDAELFDRIYNDDSAEREFKHKIYGADISPKAVEIARRNIKSAGVAKYIDLEVKPLMRWEAAPESDVPGVLVTNPPYGERIGVEDMEGLYALIGEKLKKVFTGYHAWIIGYHEEYFHKIGLAPSTKMPVLNGALECQLREYIIFEGAYNAFRAAGGSIKTGERQDEREKPRRLSDREWKDKARRQGQGGKERPQGRSRLEERYRPEKGAFAKRDRGDSFKRDRDGFTKRDRDDYPKRDKFAPSFKGKGRRDFAEPANEAESENPLQVRRNPLAIRSIKGKKPSLPPADGTFMRARNGWRTKIDRGDKNSNKEKDNDKNDE